MLRTTLLLPSIAVLVTSCTIHRGIKVEALAPESLAPQRFSSAAAAATFHRAIIEKLRPNPDDGSTRSLTIFCKWETGVRTVRGANGLLNDAFKAADRDGSGKVTQTEADAFAKEWKGDDHRP